MLKKYQTSNLFYNKYLFKLRIRCELAPLFRGMNLGFAKSRLDEMQLQAESDVPILSPFRYPRNKQKNVSLETFMDCMVIYSSLDSHKDEAMTRIEGITLDVYSNQLEWLFDLSKQVDAISLHEPENSDIEDFLFNNTNTHISDNPVKWKYKCILSKSCDPRFVSWCEANPLNVRIGATAKKAITKSHFTDGLYFWVTNKKYLMLAQIALGTKISKIVEYVYKQDIR